MALSPVVWGQDLIPREIMVEIFRHLDLKNRTKCAYVCRYWHSIVLSNQLWQDIYNKVHNLDDLRARSITKRATPGIYLITLRALGLNQTVGIKGIYKSIRPPFNYQSIYQRRKKTGKTLLIKNLSAQS
jgi:hypothetical protein